ncbi:glycine-rich domain-containing protein [Belliella aquatica]|nr:hypothetical protein [Belliella aquatica]MCH7405457.1 hypothetical protein [Belliella aquatica]
MKKIVLFIVFPLLIFLQINDVFGQVLRNTRVVSNCITEYTFGSATENEFVIVVINCNETAQGTSWQPPLGLIELTEMLMIAGGGAGGKRDELGQRGAGGGGAGGVLHITDRSTMVFNIGNQESPTQSPNLDFRIGNGGLGNILSSTRGSNGENTTLQTLNPNFNNRTALGGGAGGSSNGFGTLSSTIQPYTDQRRGNFGGSGGGSVGGWTNGNNPILGGEGMVPQGFNGANGRGNDEVNGGGGGGGANQNAPAINGNANGGNGGEGRGVSNNFYQNLVLNLLPASVPKNFAGGGGGVAGTPSGQGSAGNGGLGGGGDAVTFGNGTNGSVNTGGGGGAGGAPENNNGFRGGNGGSGIVIFRYDFFRILPIELLELSARFEKSTNSAVIKWITAKETGNSHFEIERSENGISQFEKVGEIDGMGWTDLLTKYEFIDNKLPLSGGNIFYRIKQVDFDGKSTYSKVLSVRAEGIMASSGVWRAYPNPTIGDQLRISLLDRTQYDEEQITFRIVHPNLITQGITVNSENEMNDQLALMIPKAPKGILVVEIQWGQKVEHIKILKK